MRYLTFLLLMLGSIFGVQAREYFPAQLDKSFFLEDGVGFSFPQVGSVMIRYDGKVLVSRLKNPTTYINDVLELTAQYSLVVVNGKGLMDATFKEAIADGEMAGLAYQDRKLIVGGSFKKINGESVGYIVRLDEYGNRDATFGASIDDCCINAVAVQEDGKIIVGGKFNAVNGVSRAAIARLNQDGSLDEGFNPVFLRNENVADSLVDILKIVVQGDGKILVGGNFGSVNGVDVINFVRLNENGTLDNGFNSYVNGTVFDVKVHNDKIYVSGFISYVNGQYVNGIFSLKNDGSLDDSFFVGQSIKNIQINYLWDTPTVHSFVFQDDGKVIIAGWFNEVDGVLRRGVARLNYDGSLDPVFDPGVGIGDYSTSTVLSMAIDPDGNLVFGGRFSSFQGVALDGIAKLYLSYGVVNDEDFDAVIDDADNCLGVSNVGQLDLDGDSFGDACDETPNGPDFDSDGVVDVSDNCHAIKNPYQEDIDLDGVGSACDPVNNFDKNSNGIDDGREIAAIESQIQNMQSALNALSLGKEAFVNQYKGLLYSASYNADLANQFNGLIQAANSDLVNKGAYYAQRRAEGAPKVELKILTNEKKVLKRQIKVLYKTQKKHFKVEKKLLSQATRLAIRNSLSAEVISLAAEIQRQEDLLAAKKSELLAL